MSDTPKPQPINLTTWIKSTLEMTAAAATEVNALKESKNPGEALQALARAFEKLANRAAQQAIIVRDAEKPQPINPMVQITVVNLCGGVRAAARDLEHNMGTPKAWEDFQKEIKEQAKTAESMQRIIGQTGIRQAVVLPGEPLVGEDGKPLV